MSSTDNDPVDQKKDAGRQQDVDPAGSVTAKCDDSPNSQHNECRNDS